MVTAITETICNLVPRFCTVSYGKDSPSSSGPVIWTKMDKSIQLLEPLDTSASKWFISRA